MRLIDRLDALALLTEIPAADRLVVAGAQEVFTSRMEEQTADPIIVSDEGFDEGAARVPEFDALVSGAGGQELAGAAGGRGFLQAGEGGEVRVGGWWSEGAAFDDVFVA